MYRHHFRRPARRLQQIATGAALLAAVACGGDGGTGPNSGAAGRYNIVRVNDDSSPPFTVFEGTIEGVVLRFEILSGSIDLRSNGSYSSVATTRVLVNGVSQGQETGPEQTGSYQVSGSTVTFDPAGNDPEEPNYTGTLDGNTLTLSESGIDPDTGIAMTITVVARK